MERLIQAPDALDAVGVDIADDPLLGAVVDALGARVVAPDPEMGLEFVGANRLGVVADVAVNEVVNRALLDVGHPLDANAAPALDRARDPRLFLGPVLAPRPPVDHRLIHLDDTNEGGTGEGIVAHGLADAVAQEPGRAVLDPEGALELVRASCPAVTLNW